LLRALKWRHGVCFPVHDDIIIGDSKQIVHHYIMSLIPALTSDTLELATSTARTDNAAGQSRSCVQRSLWYDLSRRVESLTKRHRSLGSS
jgi:hypothetical protein